MAVLLSGIGLLVAFMFIVMGIPFVAYLKRDLKWEDSLDKSFERWYNL